MTAPGALGAFPVVARAEAVTAFRRATGCDTGTAVPATFPMRWLAGSDVRRAILSLVPEPDLVPVHEGQSFDYVSPLELEVEYRLVLSAARSREPDRLTVHGTVVDETRGELAQLETALRLIAVPAAA